MFTLKCTFREFRHVVCDFLTFQGLDSFPNTSKMPSLVTTILSLMDRLSMASLITSRRSIPWKEVWLEQKTKLMIQC